jgi:L-lactate dehydrogenase complex protein LldE
MRVGLFVPCYVDQLAPRVAEATVAVLERVGCRVDYDPDQTCCGQPFLNLGLAREAARLARAQLERFARHDTIVCPSASCVATVRRHYAGLGVGRDPAGRRVARRTFELGEYLVRERGLVDVGARFPHRVALLASCHGLRELGLGRPSEAVGPPGEGGARGAPGEEDAHDASGEGGPQQAPGQHGPHEAPGQEGVTERLLRAVAGLELVQPARDECCGFGGAFAVEAPEVSARMGRARLAELAATGAEWVVGTDVSCLLHLDGIRRAAPGGARGPRPIHLAEVLAAT